MLHISVITSPTDTYIDELVEIFLKLISDNSTSAFNYLDDFSRAPCNDDLIFENTSSIEVSSFMQCFSFHLQFVRHLRR